MECSDISTLQNKKNKNVKTHFLKPLEISSSFRCPISLEVMTSPVSLTTGVTYDRSSIQPWLDSGHWTCPATCQPLSSTDLVPNLTLRRLISLCKAGAPPDDRTCPATCQPLNVAPPDDRPEILDESDLEGSERVMLHLDSIEGEMKENAVRDLVENLDAAFPALIRVLKKGKTVESRIAATRLIESVLISPFLDKETKVEMIEKIKLFDELVYLIGEARSKRNAVLTAIETMLNIIESSSDNNQIKLRSLLVKSNAVPTLLILIRSSETPADVAGKAMKLLEEASQCKAGLGELLGDAKQITEVLTLKMMRVGKEGREAAVGVIWGMCSKNGRGDDVRVTVRGVSGLVERLLVVLQEDCSPVVGFMAGDLLRVCFGGLRGGINGGFSKTMDIMPH